MAAILTCGSAWSRKRRAELLTRTQLSPIELGAASNNRPFTMPEAVKQMLIFAQVFPAQAFSTQEFGQFAVKHSTGSARTAAE